MRKCCECDKLVPDDIEICVSCYRKYKKSLRARARAIADGLDFEGFI